MKTKISKKYKCQPSGLIIECWIWISTRNSVVLLAHNFPLSEIPLELIRLHKVMNAMVTESFVLSFYLIQNLFLSTLGVMLPAAVKWTPIRRKIAAQFMLNL